MQVLSDKIQEENCTGMYSKGLRDQNGEHRYKRWTHLRTNITYEWLLIQSVSDPTSFKCQ